MTEGIDRLRELTDTVVTVKSKDRSVTVEAAGQALTVTISQQGFDRHTARSLSNEINSAIAAAYAALRQEYARVRQELRVRAHGE